MKLTKGSFSLALYGFIMLGVILACSSGGSSGPTCTGSVVYQGKTYNGEAGDEDKAKLFACNNYCVDADPGYEAMYGIWVTSSKGKAAGSPSKDKAIYEDKDLLDYVTKTCATKCVATMSPGAACK